MLYVKNQGIFDNWLMSLKHLKSFIAFVYI